MSSFTQPTFNQQQSCFCCSPSKVPDSTIDLTSHDAINMSSMQTNNQKTFPDPNSPPLNENTITDMISGVHIENQGGCVGSDDNSFTSPESSSIDNIQGAFGNLKINMRALHARQLGMGLNNSRKTNTASNNTFVQSDPNWYAPQMESQLSSSLPVSSIDMDLDLALDELGMLSTVTNSRKQYLLESRNQSVIPRRDRKLHKKSESSPNLASLSRMNGYRIIQLDSNYVTNVSCDKPPSPLHSSVPFSESTPIISDPSMFQYRDPQVIEANAAAARRRSIPRMSRLRKHRYNRYRCPYKIPNRDYNSMQEADFGPDYFNFNATSRVFSPQTSSPIISPNSEKHSLSKYQSKSNGTSPAKGHQDQHIARSQSVEDLLSVQRRLELVFDETNSKEAEVHLDQVATQFNGLNMS